MTGGAPCSHGAPTCLVAAMVALAAVLMAAPAMAAPSPIRLRWDAPAGCPTGDRILGETERLLRTSPARSTTEPIETTATVERAGEEDWRLHLAVRRGSESGTREIAGESCIAIAEALVLILVLMVDPAAIEEEPALDLAAVEQDPARHPVLEPAAAAHSPGTAAPPAPADELATEASAPPVPADELATETPAAAPAMIPRCGLEPSVGAFAAVAIGALPAWAPGGGAALRLRRCRVRVGAEAAVFPRRGKTLEELDAGGDFFLGAGAVTAGVAILTGDFELGPGAGLEVGAMSGRGTGVSNPRRGTALWVAATAGVYARIRLAQRLHLRIELRGVVPLHRPRFIVDDVRPVHRASPVTGRAGIGLDLDL